MSERVAGSFAPFILSHPPPPPGSTQHPLVLHFSLSNMMVTKLRSTTPQLYCYFDEESFE